MEATAFEELIEGARDLITVRRVYGDPYQQDGLTVIPAAAVRGGGGGGTGKQGDDATGTGGGFGVIARPSGAWVIENGKATWKPAVDVNWVVLGGQIVGLVAILVAGRVLHARSTRRRLAPEVAEALRSVRRVRRSRRHLPAWLR